MRTMVHSDRGTQPVRGFEGTVNAILRPRRNNKMNTTRFRIVGAVAVAIVITISAAAMTATEAIKSGRRRWKGS